MNFSIHPVPSALSSSYLSFQCYKSLAPAPHPIFNHPRQPYQSLPIPVCNVVARTAENTHLSDEPLARPFAPLTRSLAPHYSLCLRAPLPSLTRSLARSWESG